MMDRFRRSWGLAKASWAVLRSDRELVLFPLISFVALVAVLFSFLVPFLLFGIDLRTGDITPAGIVVGFLFYVVAYTVMFYFNTGLVGAAMIRLNGGDPTLGDGFRIATSRLPAIVGYALIAATVGMVLRFISERAGIIGAIIVGLLGFAWSVLTFLVVPILVVEGVGPVAAVKRSGSLLRKTWGEQLIGAGGIGIAFGLIAFAVILLGMVVVAVLFSISSTLAFLGIIALVLAVGGISLVGAALGGIYTASLYRYATSGEAGAFGEEAMTGAFRQRAKGVGGLFGRTS
jgi:uncharacterized protein DUF6159